MTPEELERWKSQQIQAAINCGVNPIDAAKAMDDYLRSLPPGASPKGYIRPAESLNQDLTTKAVRDDANGHWYGKHGATDARLLDAKGTQ